jgi:hypothetical protein
MQEMRESFVIKEEADWGISGCVLLKLAAKPVSSME